MIGLCTYSETYKQQRLYHIHSHILHHTIYCNRITSGSSWRILWLIGLHLAGRRFGLQRTAPRLLAQPQTWAPARLWWNGPLYNPQESWKSGIVWVIWMVWLCPKMVATRLPRNSYFNILQWGSLRLATNCGGGLSLNNDSKSEHKNFCKSSAQLFDWQSE